MYCVARFVAARMSSRVGAANTLVEKRNNIRMGDRIRFIGIFLATVFSLI
jgi:hypothetical protein